MRNKVFLVLSLSLLSIILFSCNKEKEIIFDQNTVDYLTPGMEWAVITEPYAAYRTDAGFENSVSGEGRRGDICLVTGKCTVKNEESSSEETTEWYKFDKGWLDNSVISLFDNKMKATTAASKLK